MKQFQFKEDVGGLFIDLILAYLMILFTLGLAAPWAFCKIQRWKANNTTIEGRKIKFVGEGSSLLGKFILWYFLTFITLGIYSFWMINKFEKFKVENTIFDKQILKKLILILLLFAPLISFSQIDDGWTKNEINIAVNLYTKTKRAFIGRTKKENRHYLYENIIYIELPVEFNGSVKIGDFFLYGNREIIPFLLMEDAYVVQYKSGPTQPGTLGPMYNIYGSY